MVAHFDRAEFGDEHAVLTPRWSAEIHVHGGNIILVTTGDVFEALL